MKTRLVVPKGQEVSRPAKAYYYLLHENTVLTFYIPWHAQNSKFLSLSLNLLHNLIFINA